MKYLVLSDIHANKVALDAVLNDSPDDIDKYICLGDILGLNGYPSETVDWVQKNTDHRILGNHDIAITMLSRGLVNSEELSRYEYNYIIERLSEDQIEWIQSLTPLERCEENGLLLAHGVPLPSKAAGFKTAGLKKGDYVSFAANTDATEYSFVMCGHTHDQASLDCSKYGHEVHILNPGSVGQPIGKASYVIVNTENENPVSLNTVKYDSEELKEHLSEISPIEWWNKTKTRRI